MFVQCNAPNATSKMLIVLIGGRPGEMVCVGMWSRLESGTTLFMCACVSAWVLVCRNATLNCWIVRLTIMCWEFSCSAHQIDPAQPTAIAELIRISSCMKCDHLPVCVKHECFHTVTDTLQPKLPWIVASCCGTPKRKPNFLGSLYHQQASVLLFRWSHRQSTIFVIFATWVAVLLSSKTSYSFAIKRQKMQPVLNGNEESGKNSMC